MTTIDPNVQRAIGKITTFCDGTGGRSQYFPFGGEGYKSSVRHFFESSTEIAAGAVQPGSADDLTAILKIIAEERAQFAVKGGGHATNPGFSSTTGIQISMSRFNKIDVKEKTKDLLPSGSDDENHSIVHIGAGCLFDEVYRKVVPLGLNIVGGSSIGGVGVAGWLLGGGYSLKTNQYGLGIDNVLQVKVVLPGKDEKTVNINSAGEDKELFEAIKGGGNNFGIVTEFTVRAHAQIEPPCGCLLQFEKEDYEDVKVAIAKFAQQKDPKASIVAAFRYSNEPRRIQSKLTVQCFYDGTQPEGDDPFEELLDIDHTTESGGGDTVGFQSGLTFGLGYAATQSFSIIKPPRLIQYNNYQDFDCRTSFINEALDTMDSRVEELSLPVYNDIQVSKTGIRNVTPNLFNLTTISTVVSGLGASMQTLSPSSLGYIKRAMVGVGEHPRGRWGNVMVDVYTKEIIDEIGNQASKAADKMPDHGGKRVVIDIWPFTKGMFDKATDCAWPHVKDEPNGPILAYFLWDGAENDDFWIRTMERVLTRIQKKVDKARTAAARVHAAAEAAAAAEGKGEDPVAAARAAEAEAVAKPLPVYMNTAMGHTPVEAIYGDNFENLRAARAKFDPDDVMDLTGGFKIPRPEESDSDPEGLYD